jgi:uncharacterized tellurite resistance protein B-like protein
MPAAVLQKVLKLLTGARGAAADESRREAIAAAALMVECARVDDAYEPSERRAIAAGVGRLFDLGPEVVELLIAVAEERAADGWEPGTFTDAIKQGFDGERRRDLVKLLCDVAYADGVFHLREAAFIRKVARELGVPEEAVGVPHQRPAGGGGGG